MKRVAWIVPGGFGPPGSGSHSPLLTRLAARMMAHVDLVVFSLDGSGSPSRTDGSFIIVPVRSPERPAKFLTGSALRALRHEHRRAPFSIVHGFWALPSGLLGGLFGRSAGVPSIASFLGGEAASVHSIGYGNLVSSGPRLRTRLTMMMVDTVHLLTRYQSELLAHAGIPVKNASVFPFGCDIERFPAAPHPAAPELRLLQVANLTEVKGQSLLLEAFQLVRQRRQARLRIVGPDQMRGALREVADRLGVSDGVEWVGPVPHDQLSVHYAWADIYVQTSLFEGQGIAVPEAMASGVPVCGTAVGLLADLPSGFARTVGNRDPIVLASTITALADDDELRTSQAARALGWSREHSLDWSVQQLLSMYDDVARNR